MHAKRHFYTASEIDMAVEAYQEATQRIYELEALSPSECDERARQNHEHILSDRKDKLSVVESRIDRLKEIAPELYDIIFAEDWLEKLKETDPETHDNVVAEYKEDANLFVYLGHFIPGEMKDKKARLEEVASFVIGNDSDDYNRYRTFVHSSISDIIMQVLPIADLTERIHELEEQGPVSGEAWKKDRIELEYRMIKSAMPVVQAARPELITKKL